MSTPFAPTREGEKHEDVPSAEGSSRIPQGQYFAAWLHKSHREIAQGDRFLNPGPSPQLRGLGALCRIGGYRLPERVSRPPASAARRLCLITRGLAEGPLRLAHVLGSSPSRPWKSLDEGRIAVDADGGPPCFRRGESYHDSAALPQTSFRLAQDVY